MKTCVIVDDEKNAREALQKMILRYFPEDLEVLALASSVKEAVDRIKETKPDVVFLDIEMPEENGLHLFKYFDSLSFDVVFTTAYQQYAINAIKYAALDYILKPVTQADLAATIKRLYNKDKISRKTFAQIEALINNLNVDSETFTKVAFPTKDGFELERIRNILYCEADGNYCKIFTITKNYIYVSKPLKHVSEMLPEESFSRIHKKYLINLNYLKSFSRTDGGFVTMDTGDILPVSTRNGDFLTKKSNLLKPDKNQED